MTDTPDVIALAKQMFAAKAGLPQRRGMIAASGRSTPHVAFGAPMAASYRDYLPAARAERAGTKRA
ncbi:MAG: hypothetical protein JWQ16_241 [Novosphingobium sp.]|nr:hypothetical protein [Novosphingobium sp.]